MPIHSSSAAWLYASILLLLSDASLLGTTIALELPYLTASIDDMSQHVHGLMDAISFLYMTEVITALPMCCIFGLIYTAKYQHQFYRKMLHEMHVPISVVMGIPFLTHVALLITIATMVPINIILPWIMHVWCILQTGIVLAWYFGIFRRMPVEDMDNTGARAYLLSA